MSKPGSLVRVRYHALKLRNALRPRFFPSKSLHQLQADPNGLSHLPDGFWFKGSILNQRHSSPGSDPRKPPDGRTVKLGTSKWISRQAPPVSRLPTLCQTPLELTCIQLFASSSLAYPVFYNIHSPPKFFRRKSPFISFQAHTLTFRLFPDESRILPHYGPAH